MATKIIYFTVNGRPEQAEFPIDCPAQDVKGKDCLKWTISFSLTGILYLFKQYIVKFFGVLYFKAHS